MTETGIGRPHGLWHLLLHRKMHPTWQKRIVHWGFLTSMIFTGLMFVNIIEPDILWPYRAWVGIVYLEFQLAEIAVRDQLNMAEIMEDHAFSAAPALVALVLTVLHLRSGGLFTPEGMQTMNFWHVIAWTDFIFGIWISSRILTTPYQRGEREAPKS